MEDLLRFAKPPPFDGHEEQWAEWSFQMRAFLSLDNEAVHTLLTAAEQQDAPIDVNGLTPENRLIARRIFYIMTMTLRGAPLGLLKSMPDQNGLEAWRQLYARYEGTSAGRQHSLLSAVLRPKAFRTDPLQWEDDLHAWEQTLARWESASGETLGDPIRI